MSIRDSILNEHPAKLKTLKTTAVPDDCTELSELYPTIEMFRKDCEDAIGKCRGVNEESFIEAIWQKAKRFGLNTYLSNKQLEWFEKIRTRI